MLLKLVYRYNICFIKILMIVFIEVENIIKKLYGNVKLVIVKEFIRKKNIVGGILIFYFRIFLLSCSITNIKYF